MIKLECLKYNSCLFDVSKKLVFFLSLMFRSFIVLLRDHRAIFVFSLGVFSLMEKSGTPEVEIMDDHHFSCAKESFLRR